MHPTPRNIFDLPPDLPAGKELFETICAGDTVKMERIISTGQRTPEGEWYDQETNEWVLLLQGEAELSFEDGTRVRLTKGDGIFLPSHTRHRVESTSRNPPCIWLAVHGSMEYRGKV